MGHVSSQLWELKVLSQDFSIVEKTSVVTKWGAPNLTGLTATRGVHLKCRSLGRLSLVYGIRTTAVRKVPPD
jgi:hypothetical protein